MRCFTWLKRTVFSTSKQSVSSRVGQLQEHRRLTFAYVSTDPHRPYEAVAAMAADPRILLQPGGTVQTRAALGQKAKLSITLVLQQVKSKIQPGVAVNDEEIEKLMDLIYADDWEPGKFCEAADETMTRRSVYNCAYTIGTLRTSLPASPKRAGRSQPRSYAARKSYQATAPRATQPWRQAGAPVKVFVEHPANGLVTFSYRDSRNSIIHGNAEIIWDCTVADGYFHAMRRNDQFMASKVHSYNLLQAVYICRNRLTYWSNPGIVVGLQPPSEQLSMTLSDIRLCRNTVRPIS